MPDAPSPPPRPPFHASSQEDLTALLSTLQRGPTQERSRAAQRLLAWPDARPAWPAVLAAYLKGEVEVDDAGLARLAGALARWPELGAPEERGRAAALLPHLAPWQLRSFVPQWLRAWEQGEWTLRDWLAGVGQERLLPFVAERVRQGNPAAAELLRPSRSFAMQALLVLLDERAPREAARLRKAPTDAPAEGASDPVDPLEGASLDELLRQLADKRVEKGLAVRAVHALLRFEERSVAPLSQLAIDRRPPIRSAALRALRAVASREHTLAVTTQVLAMETRRDVTLQLLASLGHGRHLPALPELLERVIDRDPRIRRGAIDALRAWGHDVVPAVEHVARRARPDKRRQYEALLTELEAGSDDQA